MYRRVLRKSGISGNASAIEEISALLRQLWKLQTCLEMLRQLRKFHSTYGAYIGWSIETGGLKLFNCRNIASDKMILLAEKTLEVVIVVGSKNFG